MRVDVKVSGITFKNGVIGKPDGWESVAALKPEGKVELVPEPTNENDKEAIAVVYDGLSVGYIPKCDFKRKLLKAINEKDKVEAAVKSYAYHDAKTDTFNKDHVGVFQAMDLKISIGDKSKQSKAYDPNDNHKSHYERDGKKYERVSRVLGCYDDADEYAKAGLEKWKFTKALEGVNLKSLIGKPIKEIVKALHDAYKTALEQTADDGTEMHDAIEKWILGDKNQSVPQGFLN